MIVIYLQILETSDNFNNKSTFYALCTAQYNYKTSAQQRKLSFINVSNALFTNHYFLKQLAKKHKRHIINVPLLSSRQM
ncbi:hypothetical protein GNIT_2100 [Glaciecola nitratireducens FR1064]|uniref:Uncharacterized protein n=1 Tax=Glaciecola nitratireducens (strain JCM 12485 / KCTC 12276 / FR1064) TaxID=1085623 RepID=G4QH20_GLANF|nr:hypothetical protein GNIT_2100 [Glaciecola nitratireducens FR1064]